MRSLTFILALLVSIVIVRPTDAKTQTLAVDNISIGDSKTSVEARYGKHNGRTQMLVGDKKRDAYGYGRSVVAFDEEGRVIAVRGEILAYGDKRLRRGESLDTLVQNLGRPDATDDLIGANTMVYSRLGLTVLIGHDTLHYFSAEYILVDRRLFKLTRATTEAHLAKTKPVRPSTKGSKAKPAPGLSISGVKIGQSRKSVEERLGVPYSRSKITVGPHNLEAFDYETIVVAYDDEGRVFAVKGESLQVGGTEFGFQAKLDSLTEALGQADGGEELKSAMRLYYKRLALAVYARAVYGRPNGGKPTSYRAVEYILIHPALFESR
ncbi:MAG: hypothetical protein AB7S38_41270 [Vulcanimicrobiota bacterium]